MTLGRTLAYLGLIATVFGGIYVHDRTHRYDIVATGAGSGGSQQEAGSTEVAAFLIDHTTGKVWVINRTVFTAFPVTRLTCQDISQSDSDTGCKPRGKK